MAPAHARILIVFVLSSASTCDVRGFEPGDLGHNDLRRKGDGLKSGVDWPKIRDQQTMVEWAQRVAAWSRNQKLVVGQTVDAPLLKKSPSEDLAEALASAMKRDLETRRFIYLLAKVKPGDSIAPEVLMSIASHKEPRVRTAAMTAMLKCHPDSSIFIDRIVDALENDKSLSVRMHSGRLLGELGPAAIDVVPKMLAVFKSADDPHLRNVIAESLTQIVRNDPDLRKIARDLASSTQAVLNETLFEESVLIVESLSRDQQQLHKATKKRAADVLLRGLD